jgi:hypothetical protein
LLLAPSPARAQQAAGVPVPADPFVDVQIDEQHACAPPQNVKGATQPVTAAMLCQDFDLSETFKKPTETAILAAKKACLDFYSIALRIQNIFCSYQRDEVRYRAAIEARNAQAARAEQAGEQTESQAIVADMNSIAAGLNQKYMDRIAKVGQEFHNSYPRYIMAIGKLNGAAGTDVTREANCLGLFKGTNLDLTSEVPGHLRELLATASHATAYTTYSYVMGLTRKNYSELKMAKQKAQANTDKARLNSDLAVPTILGDSLQQEAKGQDDRQPLTPSEGAVYGAFQDLITRGIKAKFPSLAGPLGSIIGGGIVVVWQYSANKRIMLPETAATFIGMLNPYAGMAANVLVGAYRTSEARTAEYREFTKTVLKGKVNVLGIGGNDFGTQRAPGSVNTTAAQVVEAWGQYKKAPACVESAKMEAHCVAIRPGLPAYSGSNCARSPLSRAQSQSTITR